MKHTTLDPQTHAFSDRLGRFFENNGLPRMAGRLMGRLLTCMPAEQTFEEMVAATGASRSSVSVASQLLVRLALVERFGVPGERKERYRLRDDAWTSLLRQDMAAANELRQLAEDGLLLMKPHPRARSARLQGMKQFYVFLGEALVPVLAEWEKRQAVQRAGRKSP